MDLLAIGGFVREGGLSRRCAAITAACRQTNRGTGINVHFVFFDFFVLSLDLDLWRIGHTTLPFCPYIAGMILVRTLQRKHGLTDSGTVSNVNLSHGPLVHAVVSNNIRVTWN